MILLLGGVCIAWIVIFIVDVIESQRVTWFSAHALGTSTSQSPRRYPSVSIVVAARNEADIIERALSSLLRLDYPEFEVILVDDQSTDGTGEIARGLAAKDSRLSVVTGADLPAGWMGKSWALHQGVPKAQGEWLLFTDADCLHHQQSLQVAMEYALSERKDFVSLVPAVELMSLSEKLVMPAFLFVFGTFFPLEKFNRHPEKALAAGGFILIKHDVYEAVGGHASIRSSIVDDVSLAKAVKRIGGAVWTGLTRDLVVTEQYPSFSEVWEGLRKHAFVLMGESSVSTASFVLRAAMFVSGALLMVALPMAGLGVGLIEGDWQVVGLSAVSVSMLLLLGIGSTWLLGIRWGWGLLLPIGFLLYLLIVIDSVVKVLRGKLVWSGRQYGRSSQK